jgi:hypothetical protein
MECEPKFVPMNFKTPPTEIDLPISDLDSDSDSDSTSTSESELTDIEINNAVKEEPEELETLLPGYTSPSASEEVFLTLLPRYTSPSASEDEVSDDENNSVDNQGLSVNLTPKSKPIDIIKKNELKPPSSPRSNNKTNPFQLNSSDSSDDNKEKKNTWW